MILEKNGREYEVESAHGKSYRAKAQCGRWADWRYTITAALDAAALIDQQEREYERQCELESFNDEQLRRARVGVQVHPDSQSQL